jgi:hypothetical protein
MVVGETASTEIYTQRVRWHVYADLSRPLTTTEQGAVFAAIDAIVPESGCVGPNASGCTEVYFVVEAASLEHAEVEAKRYLDSVLRSSGVGAANVVTLRAAQPIGC